MKVFIQSIIDKVLLGEDISFEESLKLINIDEANTQSINQLLNGANTIRKKYVGNKVDLCTIMNVKSGKCSENCIYCAQSSHYKTTVNSYDILDYDSILARALEVEEQGAHRFSLVTSGRGIKDEKELKKLITIYKRLKKDTKLNLCASHGIITYEQAVQLKEAGISMYHHNIETSEDYYSTICTTHTFQDRIDTINNVKKAGLKICCGGIIGLGENREQRVQMLFDIKSLNIKSIPLNILTPVKGTPLENQTLISPLEALKTMAVCRYIIPDSYIRYAGGRMILKDKQKLGFEAGVNAALVGNYLTTIGSNIEEDKEMITCLGLEI